MAGRDLAYARRKAAAAGQKKALTDLAETMDGHVLDGIDPETREPVENKD